MTKNKLFYKYSTGENSSGFALPTVLFLVLILSSVAFATLLQANNSLNLAYKQSYLQIARVASKSAVDYAKEEFDNSLCGEYSGTAETDLVSNSRYRVTMKADVISTSADGFEKVIKGTGSIYLPKRSTTAKYVFDIRSEIVRTYATCKTPADFAPVLWLDASNAESLKSSNTATVNIDPIPTTGSGILDLILPNDTVEEKVSDGTQGPLSWLSDDLEMHTCDSLEYAFFLCSFFGQRDLYNGLIFKNVTIPKGATINTATIQLKGASPAGSGGRETHRIYGIYKSATNPHIGMFDSFSSNQVKKPITTAGWHTNTYEDIETNNISPGNKINFDVKDVVQEMVNNANWNPTGSGNGGRIGFGIYRVSGSGNRVVLKDGITFSVSYTTSGAITQATNNSDITEWDDISGNANHARFAYGNKPKKIDNQINSKPIVRFNNGTLLSQLVAPLQNKREMNVLAVVKPNFSSSSTDGRLITGMSTGGTNDSSGSNAIIPLFRNASNNGFSSNYSGSGTSYRTDYNCGSTCNDLPYLFTSLFTLNDQDTAINSILKGNGSQVANKDNLSPPASPAPYRYSIDQLYIGGRRNGALASGTGADYFNGDYAEIIVFDKSLTCRQIESLEDYLRTKWNLSSTAYTSTCPANVIPVL